MSEKLGRKFSDLITENQVTLEESEVVTNVQLDDIIPNPDQPRKIFDIDSLNEMAESITEHGIIQPVILKPGHNGYILVAGERRVRAAKIAGLDEVPAIIRDYNSIFLAELAILENLQREDLTSIEEAIAYQNAVSKLNITHAELAKKIGKSRSYLTNIIGLLNLPQSIIDLVNQGLISMGHARSLSKLKDSDFALELAKKILSENLTVRELEGIIKNEKNNTEIEDKSISDDLKNETQKRVSKYFNNKFKVNMSKNTLKISFKNEDELVDFIKYFKEKDDVE